MAAAGNQHNGRCRGIGGADALIDQQITAGHQANGTGGGDASWVNGGDGEGAAVHQGEGAGAAGSHGAHAVGGRIKNGTAGVTDRQGCGSDSAAAAIGDAAGGVKQQRVGSGIEQTGELDSAAGVDERQLVAGSGSSHRDLAAVGGATDGDARKPIGQVGSEDAIGQGKAAASASQANGGSGTGGIDLQGTR